MYFIRSVMLPLIAALVLCACTACDKSPNSTQENVRNSEQVTLPTGELEDPISSPLTTLSFDAEISEVIQFGKTWHLIVMVDGKEKGIDVGENTTKIFASDGTVIQAESLTSGMRIRVKVYNEVFYDPIETYFSCIEITVLQ